MRTVSYAHALASLTILIGLAQTAEAQAPALHLQSPALGLRAAPGSEGPSLRIETLNEDASHIDVATPAVLTAIGGAATVGGLATAFVERGSF